MNKAQIRYRTRQYLNETSGGGIWKDADINSFMNEALDRISSIKELSNISYLDAEDDEVELLPRQYHYLLSVYACARCFEQDDSQFQAIQKMNEFESKLEELISKIASGDVVIKDKDGNVISSTVEMDGVSDVYSCDRTNTIEDKFETVTP